MVIKYTSPQLYKEIEIANELIANVKQMLGKIPLNQRGKGTFNQNYQDIENYATHWTGRNINMWSSIIKDCQNGNARYYARAYNPGERNGVSTNWKSGAARPGVTAAAMAKSDVGMCQDYAAVCYKILREIFPKSRKISYVNSTTMIHWFATIGDWDKRNDANEYCSTI